MFLDEESNKHSWINFYEDKAPYTCNCGLEFDTHKKLMEHTATFNPPIETYKLGVAGVAIEREAHEDTLANLNKALDLIESVRMEELVTFSWHDEATEFLKKMGREADDD